MMKLERILNYGGLALLAAVFLTTALRVVTREVDRLDPDTTTVRIAHTLLDAGLREAFDEIAADYERLQAESGRSVRIVQMAIPDRVYAQWMRTQLIGETAPQIIMGNVNALDDSLVTRFFRPISDVIDDPNPYNEGTVHEGRPWRDTFIDGLEVAGFHFRFAENYGLPLSAATVRVYLNEQMLERILEHPASGDLRERLDPDLVPSDFRAFLALCEAVQRYSRATDQFIVPIAGSMYNGELLMDRLFQSQTQRMYFDEDWATPGDYRVTLAGVAPGLIERNLSLRNPAFESGFRLMQKVGNHMQPGFLQLQREDAMFYFTQERALMIVSSSEDAPSFRLLSGDRFDMLVFPVPTPSRDDPEFGRFVLGPTTEATASPTAVFNFVNYHPEASIQAAIDFMRFLTSHPVNSRFSELSGWLPSVVEARTAPESEPFLPVMEGYSAGPNPFFGNQELRSVGQAQYYRLFGEGGNLEAFLDRFESRMLEVLPGVMGRLSNRSRENIRQQDLLLASHLRLQAHEPEHGAEHRHKVSMLIDSQAGNEANRFFGDDRVEQALGRPPSPRAEATDATIMD